MNSNQNLPAVLLPNVDNAQDTTAILRNGAKITVTDLLRIIEVGADLRFMVKASEPRDSKEPRITWCSQGDGTVIAAAAFVCGSDNHGRIVSSALVFELSESKAFLSQIPPGLPSDQLRNLQDALDALHSSFLRHVEGRRQLGKTGGEYSPEKRQFGTTGGEPAQKSVSSERLVEYSSEKKKPSPGRVWIAALLIGVAFIAIEFGRRFL